MIIEWIICKIKNIFLFSLKTSFTFCYTLFWEIWALILKYPKLWIGMLLFFLSTLLSIKHCKVGFFINYKENIVNHNYTQGTKVLNKYCFSRALLDSIFRDDGKIINDYVETSLKNDKNHYGNKKR